MPGEMHAFAEKNDGDDLHGLVGQVVAGRFRVLSVFFAGPRGIVYEVEPPGVGRERRALKVIDLPEAREPIAVERLARYVEIAQTIRHPHLETVHEMGYLADDTPYVLTEWIPLSSIADALAGGGRLHTYRVREIARAVGEALGVLHGRGLCHGDVRPGHVLVEAAREGYQTIKLVGAGITARLEAPHARGLRGSLAFTAPERFAGQRATVASDVYSMGALIYLLLSGRPPFSPSDARAEPAGPDPIARMRWLHEHAAPHRPMALVDLPDFSPAVEAVIARAMAKDPEARYPDGKALLDAFDRAFYDPDGTLAEIDQSLAFAEVGDAGRPPPEPLVEPVIGRPIARSEPIVRWALAGALMGMIGALLYSLMAGYPG